MQRNFQVSIFDILSAIHEIESFIANIDDVQTYSDDNKTKRAVERNLEIIGEAVKNIPQNMRNTLAVYP